MERLIAQVGGVSLVLAQFDRLHSFPQLSTAFHMSHVALDSRNMTETSHHRCPMSLFAPLPGFDQTGSLISALCLPVVTPHEIHEHMFSETSNKCCETAGAQSFTK